MRFEPYLNRILGGILGERYPILLGICSGLLVCWFLTLAVQRRLKRSRVTRGRKGPWK